MTAPQGHPEPVKAAIRAAVREGLKTAEIHRQLENGTLTGLEEPYRMPVSTVDYYVRQTRRRDAASIVTKLAAGDPSHAVDHLARQLLSEAELGVMEARGLKKRDPELVKRWADVLKVLGPLLRPVEEKKPKRRRKTETTDPLAARLNQAAKNGTSKPSPDTPTPDEDQTTAETAINAEPATTTPNHEDHDHTTNGRVLVQADRGPVTGGGGVPDHATWPPPATVAPPFAPHLGDLGR